ncbi:MAG: tetratricopeptide repeat protein [Candidatus Omnitrophota bacterium]
MRRSVFIILQAVFILCGFHLFAFAEDSFGLVKKANNLYREKKYDEAAKLYNEAQIKSPDSAQISYNIGTTQYKKGDYLLAVGSFEKATASKDKLLESKANFNIANSKYKLGKLKENTELKETVNLLRQSLDYYKRVIELNSRDEDAKINHELVEKELKALLDKLKQEQDKKKDKSEQSQNGQQQEQKQQASGAQEQKADQQKNEEAKTGREARQAEGQKQDQAKEEEARGQGAEEAGEMSEREATMLLEGHRQEEDSSGKLEDNRKGASSEEVLKDW